MISKKTSTKLLSIILCVNIVVLFSNTFAQNLINVDLTVKKDKDTLSLIFLNYNDCGAVGLDEKQSNYDMFKNGLLYCTEIKIQILKDSIIHSEINAICEDCKKNEKTHVIENLNFRIIQFKGNKISIVLFGKNNHIGEFAYVLSGKFLNKKNGEFHNFQPIGTNYLIDGVFNELYYFNETGELIYNISTENRVNNKMPYFPPNFNWRD